MMQKKTETNEILRKMKEGRVQKNDCSDIPIEMKTYKLSQLSALEGRFKKISVNLSIDEEKNDGRSIMVNIKTSTFEIMKRRLIGLLEKHILVKSVNLVRTAKASTEDYEDADVEYHLDVEMIVEENIHKLKLKVFNTNCRIQIQQFGKDASPKEHLGLKAPPRYFAENVILPFAKVIDDSIPAKKKILLFT